MLFASFTTDRTFSERDDWMAGSRVSYVRLLCHAVPTRAQQGRRCSPLRVNSNVNCPPFVVGNLHKYFGPTHWNHIYSFYPRLISMHFRVSSKSLDWRNSFGVSRLGGPLHQRSPGRGDSGGGGAARCRAALRLLNHPPCRAQCGSCPAEVISPASKSC